jgi:hypothetical protein
MLFQRPMTPNPRADYLTCAFCRIGFSEKASALHSLARMRAPRAHTFAVDIARRFPLSNGIAAWLKPCVAEWQAVVGASEGVSSCALRMQCSEMHALYSRVVQPLVGIAVKGHEVVSVRVRARACVCDDCRQVESTLSKSVLRIVGTWVGGSLGYAVMLNSDLATNPWGE